MVLKEQSIGKNIQQKQIKRKTDSYIFPIGPSFQGVNRLFVLSFEKDDGRESHKQNYLQQWK